MGFVGSHLWDIRQVWGAKKILYPGVFTLIQNARGEFLAGHRTDNESWGCISGHMELNEKLEDAVRREVFEESGLKVLNLACFGLASDPAYTSAEYPNGDKVHHVTALFKVEVAAGEPQIHDDEHHEWRYFSAEDLAKVTGNTTRRFLQAFAEYQTTGQFQLI